MGIREREKSRTVEERWRGVEKRGGGGGGGFFFQAEGGIRDLVRSRGLGDVYERQLALLGVLLKRRRRRGDRSVHHGRDDPVPYTHLTLPTIHSV